MYESDARTSRDRRFDLKNSFRQIPGSICAPRGFKCAAVFCDIKKLGTGKGSEKGQKQDLALIVSDVPAAVAGVFTTNQVCAAPVKISRQRAAKKLARAIVINSGNANACTGRQGLTDARHMTQLAAKALSIKENEALVCSTGRIGGVCKGAGMIQPGMATMLGFIASDAAIEPAALKRALKIAVEQSFNRITVDGDMSTNDSVIALANGLAGNSRSQIRRSQFQNALNHVCLELAKMIVRDGEGTSRFVALHLRGARNDREAGSAARAIANSSLVRTSWGGGDPNWGRILCALGYSKAGVDERIVDVGYAQPGSHKIVFAFRRGRPTNVALKTLARITSAPEFDLHVNLHRGRGEFVLYAADLTEDYVAFNKGDITDPATLGG